MTERVRQGGFQGLKVVAKVQESRIITSFHLEPVDPTGWQPFRPGQFLVLRVPADGQRRAVPRSYSVSSSPGLAGRYRITIKREAAPSADVPDGVGSCWLHDRINVGDVIQAAGPRGEFCLDEQSPRPVVLLSGGVGLTPLVSMLHALATGSTRPVHFIHACDNGELHALRDEVIALAGMRPGIDVHFCYRFPTETDRARRHHHSEGVLTRAIIDGLLPAREHDFYMCGPPPFMKAVYGLLRARGEPKERIAYEFFGPATVLEGDVQAAQTTKATATAATSVSVPVAPASEAAAIPGAAPARDWITLPAAPAADAATFAVEFRHTGRTVAWDTQAASLLDFAEEQGLNPDFSCRAGVCGTCRTALIAGEIEYLEDPLDPPGAGEVLICCAKPKGPIVLDL